MRRRSVLGMTLMAILILGGGTAAVGADQKADPTGTWKWTSNVNGQEIKTELRLKMEGGKLTGVIVGDDKEVKITDATFKDGEIRFKAERERSGAKVPVKYKGKLSGDTIKGKVEVSLDGQELSLDWNAKRVKDKKK